MKEFLSNWKLLSSDPEVLQMVSGCRIELDCMNFQCPGVLGKQTYFVKETHELDEVIEEFVNANIVIQVPPKEKFYVSPIFTVPKKDGSVRMILNLKRFNEYVTYKHFKMDTVNSAIDLMSENCFMASVDLKHAYYSVPVHEYDQRFLQFEYRQSLFQFTCLPMGLSSSPRIFTKICKPVYAALRQKGHIVVGYIDDTYLQSESYSECERNIAETVDLLESLGFVVNREKSVLKPTQKVEFLGFELDSVNMKVTVTEKKMQKIVDFCVDVLEKESISIRVFASLIGKLVAAGNGVEFAPLYHRQLEIEKIQALKCNAGSFDATIVLSDKARENILWWIDNLHSQYKLIDHGQPDVFLRTDASNKGWGAKMLSGNETNGMWSREEREFHINSLELLAVYFGLRSFCANRKDIHVRVEVDNTTALNYINKMGGVKSEICNEIAKCIWLWCIKKNIWLSAMFIKGVENVEADSLSRHFNERTEWMLKRDIFKKIEALWSRPTVDLFASRINYQIEKYVSWHPDPGAFHVDAFTLDWSDELFYCFPPFCLINKCIQKILLDRAEGLLVVPWWPTQVWWPVLGRILIYHPVLLPPTKRILGLPSRPKAVHPLRLQMMACWVSGVDSLNQIFRKRLPKSSCNHGRRRRNRSTDHTSRDSKSIVIQDRLIICKHL